MITKHGKAALQKRLTIPCEITRDSVSELVFSLRSKRRFRKARLEAARWVVRTTFGPQSVLYQFPVSQLPVLQLYTRLPCCTRLTMTHNFNATKGSDKHQRLILLSCCFGIGCGANGIVGNLKRKSSFLTSGILT